MLANQLYRLPGPRQRAGALSAGSGVEISRWLEHGDTLELDLPGVGRDLDDGHYFACTDFRVAGTKDQIYDIDFWVNDKDGTLSVEQTKVHKVPELKDGQNVQVPRYEWKDVGSSHVVP